MSKSKSKVTSPNFPFNFSSFLGYATLILLVLGAILQNQNANVSGQIPDPITLEYLQGLSDQIDSINATNKGLQSYINSLQDEINQLKNKQSLDINDVADRANDLFNDLAAVSDRTATADGLVPDYTETDKAITASMKSVTKFDSVNQIWKGNWQVVKKTFAQLRRKVVFTQVPVFYLG